METIIIVGGVASGKTMLAKMLTHNCETGVVIDHAHNYLFPTRDVIKRFLLIPRVVITSEDAGAVRSHPQLKEFFSLRPAPIVIKIGRGDDSPLVPPKALQDPIRFRLFLLDNGSKPIFIGGKKELLALRKKLPKHPTYQDCVKQLQFGSWLRAAKPGGVAARPHPPTEKTTGKEK